MRTKFLIALCVLLTGGALWVLTRVREEQVVTIEDTELRVEIADTDAERMRGLSGRESLAPYDALLFIFYVADVYGFWMKDMRFAIDIVWIDADTRVIGIEKNISPDTFPKSFYPPAPSMYVLELPAGTADDAWLGKMVHMR